MTNKWFEPDSRWESVVGVNSLDEYLDLCVLEGKFHSAVHEDILKDYEVVEYLMAHAYYFWPMYDEAARKLASMFELAIKKKCEIEGIELSRTLKNGSRRNKTVGPLVKELLVLMGWEDQKKHFSSYQWTRNHYAHPDRHSFGGSMHIRGVVYQVNFFNKLFWPSNWYKTEKDELAQLEPLEAMLKDKLFILNHEEQNILVYDAKPVNAFKLNNEWVHYWHFYPVLVDTFDRVRNHWGYEPLSIFLKQEGYTEKGMEAVNQNENKPFQLSVTNKSENLLKYKTHLIELKRAEFRKGELISGSYTPKADLKYEQFLSDHCWDNT